MRFKKELKALEILEQPEEFLTGGFNVNHIIHSKWFSQTRNEKITNSIQRPVLFIAWEGGEPGIFLGGVVTWFSGGMKWGREDLSSPTEYKGDYSQHLSPGRGGTEGTWFSGGS